jgi:hypothetical protein
MTLWPLWSIEQTKAAILRYAYETAKHHVRYSEEYPLEICVRQPFRQHSSDELDNHAKAYSIAFVFTHGALLLNAFERGDVVFRRDSKGETWVDLTQSNILTILEHLDKGHGRLVVRCWFFWTRAGGMQRRGYGVYHHDDNLQFHQRLCEAASAPEGSAAESPGAGSAFAGSAFGSGAGSPAGSGMNSGELRACNDAWGAQRECYVCCHYEHHPGCPDEDVSVLHLNQH